MIRVFELFEKIDFDDLFETIKSDYFMFFARKTNEEKETLKENFLSAFDSLKKTEPIESEILIIADLKKGYYHLSIQNDNDLFENSMSWGKINGSYIDLGFCPYDQKRLLGSVLWELTFWGYTEEESIKAFKKAKNKKSKTSFFNKI